MPTKSEREEMELLREKYEKSQFELQNQASKHKTAIESMRSTVTVLTNERVFFCYSIKMYF